MVIIYMSHFYGKSYYYHHCDRNLLKTLFYKHSKICTTIGTIIEQTESWFITNTSNLIKYWVFIANEMPILSTLFTSIQI